MPQFNDDELKRYSRHLSLPEIGIDGQSKLRDAKVLIVGAGGLGSPVALYLAAAGVGNICIIDGDVVDLSNLQRQIIHSTSDVGRAKVESASQSITALNPGVKVEAISGLLTADNAASLMADYDIIVDATDSLATKLLINDTCVALGKPFVHGGMYRYMGQAMTYVPGSPCYRCLFAGEEPVQPGNEAVAGPFGAVAGILGCIQAAEVIKYITGIGRLLTGRLLRFDALTMEFDTFTLPADNRCRCRRPLK